MRGYVHLHNRGWGAYAGAGKHRPNPSTKPEPDHRRVGADTKPCTAPNTVADPKSHPEPYSVSERGTHHHRPYSVANTSANP